MFLPFGWTGVARSLGLVALVVSANAAYLPHDYLRSVSLAQRDVTTTVTAASTAASTAVTSTTSLVADNSVSVPTDTARSLRRTLTRSSTSTTQVTGVEMVTAAVSSATNSVEDHSVSGSTDVAFTSTDVVIEVVTVSPEVVITSFSGVVFSFTNGVFTIVSTSTSGVSSSTDAVFVDTDVVTVPTNTHNVRSTRSTTITSVEGTVNLVETVTATPLPTAFVASKRAGNAAVSSVSSSTATATSTPTSTGVVPVSTNTSRGPRRTITMGTSTSTQTGTSVEVITVTASTSSTTTTNTKIVTVTGPAKIITVTAPAPTDTESTLDQAKEGCIECQDILEDNGWVLPETLPDAPGTTAVKRSLDSLEETKGDRKVPVGKLIPLVGGDVEGGSEAVETNATIEGQDATPVVTRQLVVPTELPELNITDTSPFLPSNITITNHTNHTTRTGFKPIRLSPINNITVTNGTNHKNHTNHTTTQGGFKAIRLSPVNNITICADQPEPLPQNNTESTLPLNFTFSETLLPLDKDAFVDKFNRLFNIQNPNTTVVNDPSAKQPSATSPLNSTTLSDAPTSPLINLSAKSAQLSSVCNCAHNNNAHSWRDSMSPVDRATEICISGGGCKITHDYEEMCVMVGGGPDPCACIAGALGEWQSHHRGVWWIWSAVHCGGSAVVVTDR